MLVSVFWYVLCLCGNGIGWLVVNRQLCLVNLRLPQLTVTPLSSQKFHRNAVYDSMAAAQHMKASCVTQFICCMGVQQQAHGMQLRTDMQSVSERHSLPLDTAEPIACYRTKAAKYTLLPPLHTHTAAASWHAPGF